MPHDRIPLDPSYDEVLKHMHRLWGFEVKLEERKDNGKHELLATCPKKND
ncbi:hypothetical protein [Bacillus cereus group sp. Bce039]